MGVSPFIIIHLVNGHNFWALVLFVLAGGQRWARWAAGTLA